MLRNIKKITIYLFLALTSFFAHAQTPDCYFKLYRHDIGITGGATYYMGDFNERLIPLLQPSYYGGLLYRFYINTQHAIRAQVSYGHLSGDAFHAPHPIVDPSGNNWKFDCPIMFVDVVAEIGFKQLNVVELRKKERFSPFISLGVGYILRFSDKEYASPLQNDKSNVTRQYLSIPVGIGMKYSFAPRFTAGVEWTIRKTFVDDMDNYNNVTPQGSVLINTDWLCNVGVTLAYRLPEQRTCPAYPTRKKQKGLAESQR